MIEKDITIVESELKSGAKGDYLYLVDHEGVKFSCFKEHKASWGLLGKNMSARVGFEIKGIYKNIVEATPMGEQIQVDETKITEQQVPPPLRAQPVADSIRENMEWKDAQIDKKFWWGQLGNRIGDGTIDRDFPKSAVKIMGQYYKQMETITGITFKKEDS